MKRLVWIILCSMFFVVTFSGVAHARSKDLFYFSDFEVKKKLNDKWSIFIQPTMRFKHDAGTLYYFHLRNGVQYRANKNLDLGFTYRFVEGRSRVLTEINWDQEHRLEMDIAPKIKLGDLSIVDRSRFEYRYFETASQDKWRYRNKFQLAHPFEIFDCKFKGFVSEEIFFDLNTDEIVTHWITPGVSKKLTDHLTATLYCIFEFARTAEGVDDWNQSYIAGTKLGWSF